MTSILCTVAFAAVIVGQPIEEQPGLSVQLTQPKEPFQIDEPIRLSLRFANATDQEITVGPFAVEGTGQVHQSVSVCATNAHGGGVTGSYVVDNRIDVRVTPVVDAKDDEVVEVEVVEEVEELLEEGGFERAISLRLGPAVTKEIELDLAKTDQAELLSQPGKYDVQLELQFETRFSPGFPHTVLRPDPWQGRTKSNTIRIVVSDTP